MERCRKKRKEEESYFEAAKEWKTQKSLPKNERISCRIIVDGINKKMIQTLVRRQSVLEYLKGSKIQHPPKVAMV